MFTSRFFKEKKLEQRDDNVKEISHSCKFFASFFIFGAQFFCGNSNLKHLLKQKNDFVSMCHWEVRT